MEYSIGQLADMAGISTRTLRYYDDIDLLKPLRTCDAGYRYYGEQEVDLLQQILFYRERGLGLSVIQEILQQPGFDVDAALAEHLSALQKQEAHIRDLIQTVEKTIAERKGERSMKDSEKFAAFKRNLVEENDARYGEEVRSKYGKDAAEEANRRILNMSEETYEEFTKLEEEILTSLEEAAAEGAAPESETGNRIVQLHRQWLSYTWKDYSPQAHKGLAQMYTADDRFREYYDRKTEGCAAFLTAAILYWAEA